PRGRARSHRTRSRRPSRAASSWLPGANRSDRIGCASQSIACRSLLSTANESKLPRMNATLPPVGLREQLPSGEVASVHATQAYLARIALLDDDIHAFVTVDAEGALEQARAADEALAAGRTPGPLHGLPVALKDNIDTAGVRTTVGSPFFADRVP